jgi:hypothetical protein
VHCLHVSSGSLWSILPRPRCVRLAGNLGHAHAVMAPIRTRTGWRTASTWTTRASSSPAKALPRATRRASAGGGARTNAGGGGVGGCCVSRVMRCRPGIVTNSESISRSRNLPAQSLPTPLAFFKDRKSESGQKCCGKKPSEDTCHPSKCGAVGLAVPNECCCAAGQCQEQAKRHDGRQDQSDCVARENISSHIEPFRRAHQRLGKRQD